MNLQESIRRILREDDYSPAGKEIIPNSIIVHKSNPMFRDKIIEEGLKVRAGECYKIYVGYGIKCKPAIFATNTTNKRAWFDSTYDDDIWFIDTRMIPDVKWYKDRHFESTKKHIVTFQDIPKEAITLKYEGTGSGDVKTWPKDSPNLYESRIKEHPRQEEFNKYKDNIDDIVYSVVSKEELCGYGTEFFINSGEDALRIVLYYKDGLYPGYEKHTENTKEIKFMLENYLPIVDKAFVAFDSTVCKKRMVESVDEVERNLKVINLILNEISFDNLCDIWVEYNKDDGEYEIRSKTTSRNMGFDEELSFLDRTLSSMGIKVFIFAPWFVDDCEDEVKFLNESKEQTNYMEILKELVEPFKEDLGICDIKAIYDDEDDMYSVYLLFGMEELNDKYTSNGKYLYVITKVKEVKDTIKSYLPIQNLYVGSYEKPNCGWKRMNESDESKDKSTKELITAVLNTLVLPQYEHVICGFEYKEEKRLAGKNGKTINSPSVTVTLIGGYGTRMWPNTQAVQKMYDDLLDEVWDTVWDYTGISVELYSNYVKDCNNYIK